MRQVKTNNKKPGDNGKDKVISVNWRPPTPTDTLVDPRGDQRDACANLYHDSLAHDAQSLKESSSDHYHNRATRVLPQNIWGYVMLRGRLDSLLQPRHIHPSIILPFARRWSAAEKLLRYLPSAHIISLVEIPHTPTNRVSIRAKA
ncbi:hypothetical protein PIB30_011466 [Stylosanthes scabra]|uniref:Uncharacterized protein n=1 Tax=Stylosanthes scabra TaxID=79078 RepID=A0ABU6R4P6_9FABA|nr:hypothetical protein [Stylosanthes scabra]